MNDHSTMLQPKRLRKLLKRLVDIYSPSGKEEEVLDFLRTYLKRHGLPVFEQPVDDNRSNLLVLPSEGEVQVAFIGHLDTVVAYDLDDYAYDERGDEISGLGTADMKGGCAAMIEAYIALWETGRGSFPAALCLLVGEEEDGDGAEHLVKDYHFPWAIVGEPTDLRPCLSHYGYLEINFATLGRRMHASLANTRQNAVESLLGLMLDISRYLEREHPELVYNIRDLFSSQAGFAVPERCEAWLDIHLPPAAPIGEIIAELEEIVGKARRGNASVEVTHRIATIDSGYDLPEKGSAIEALKSVYESHSLPWEPQAFRSHSDANRLWTAGVKTILVGPGNLEKAHTPEEAISFRQVFKAAELYLDFMTTLFEAESQLRPG